MTQSLTKCIACAEEIQVDAKLCKHCNTTQDDQRFLGSATGITKMKGGPRRRSLWIWLTLLVVLLLAGGTAAGVLLMPRSAGQGTQSHGSYSPKNSGGAGSSNNGPSGHNEQRCTTIWVENPNYFLNGTTDANGSTIFEPRMVTKQQCQWVWVKN